MDTHEYSSENISEYNESALKNLRLAECWNRCNVHKSTGNLKQWKIELDIACDELLPDGRMLLSPTDYKAFSSELKTITTNIINAKTKANLQYWLRQKERTLRYLQNKIGRGVKVRTLEDAGRAIAMD